MKERALKMKTKTMVKKPISLIAKVHRTLIKVNSLDQGETENSSEPPSQPGNNGNNGNGNNGTNGNGQGNNQQPPATPDQQTENE